MQSWIRTESTLAHYYTTLVDLSPRVYDDLDIIARNGIRPELDLVILKQN